MIYNFKQVLWLILVIILVSLLNQYDLMTSKNANINQYSQTVEHLYLSD